MGCCGSPGAVEAERELVKADACCESCSSGESCAGEPLEFDPKPFLDLIEPAACCNSCSPGTCPGVVVLATRAGFYRGETLGVTIPIPLGEANAARFDLVMLAYTGFTGVIIRADVSVDNQTFTTISSPAAGFTGVGKSGFTVTGLAWKWIRLRFQASGSGAAVFAATCHPSLQ